jgi:hypothetical protein
MLKKALFAIEVAVISCVTLMGVAGMLHTLTQYILHIWSLYK